MRLIEAMKKVKMNKEKIKDLRNKIQENCANLTHETPQYGDGTKAQIDSWVNSCVSLSSENIALLLAIQQTNIATLVTITIGGVSLERSIAYWVWRRREYAKSDMDIYRCLGDRGLKEGQMAQSVGAPITIKIVRHFDSVARDAMIERYRSEPHLIDATLEVVNATTELLV